MKKPNAFAVVAMMVVGLMIGLTACSDDDDPENPAPKVTISLRSCSITEGTE